MPTIVGQLILYIKFVSHRNGVIDKIFSFSTEFFFLFYKSIEPQVHNKTKTNPTVNANKTPGNFFLLILGILFFFFFFWERLRLSHTQGSGDQGLISHNSQHTKAGNSWMLCEGIKHTIGRCGIFFQLKLFSSIPKSKSGKI